jgi:RimJ/RimL family protein N-acetyltransferase
MSPQGYRTVDPPPGYPPEYERDLRLRDGRTVQIRPIIPSDAWELAEAIRSADADTLRRRFLGSPPPITPALLAHLSTVDYRSRFALIAADPVTGHGIAIARYESTPQRGVAEVAVAVDPAWRRVGLATALVELLAQAALDRGIHTFTACYLAQNRPVAALLHLADQTRQPQIKQGIAEAAIALDRDTVAAAIRDVDATHATPNHRPPADASRRRGGAPPTAGDKDAGPDGLEDPQIVASVEEVRHADRTHAAGGRGSGWLRRESRRA